MTRGPLKNPLDFVGNLDHVALGLWLRLIFHITPGRTVLRLGEGRVVARNTGHHLPGICSMVIRGDCMGEVCTVLNALLVSY